MRRLRWEVVFPLGGAIGAIVFYATWWLTFLRGNLQGPDFYIYYAESLLLRRAGGRHAYDPTIQKQFQDLVTAQWPGQFVLLPHILPPYASALLYPLSLLPYRWAYIGWALLQLILTLVGLGLLVRAAGLRGRSSLYFGLLSAAFLPVFIILLMGQADGIAMLGLGASAYFWRQRRPLPAALSLLLCLVKPQLVLAVPVLLFVRGARRAVLIAGAGVAAILGASWLMFGSEGWRDYALLVSPWLSGRSGDAAFSLRGLASFLPGGLPVLILGLLVALSVGGVALSVRPHRQRLDFALAVAFSMAISPYQHMHDLAILLGPLVLTAGLLRKRELRWPRLGWTMITACYLAVDAALWLGPWPGAVSVMLLAAYLIAERLAVAPDQIAAGELPWPGGRARRVVVLPAYYAAKTLREVIDRIPKGEVDEILLVDDHSGDNTTEVARELGLKVIRHPVNLGYGGNQKTCYENAVSVMGADVVVMLHPDGQYEPELVPALCREIEEGRGDIALGSRWLGIDPAEYGMPWWKRIGNRFLTWTENRVLGLKLSEYHSGYRAYSRRFLETIPFPTNSNDFVFDSQVLIQAATFGFRIAEIPCPGRYFADASSISFKTSVKYGLATLACLLAYLGHRIGLTPVWLEPREAPQASPVEAA